MDLNELRATYDHPADKSVIEVIDRLEQAEQDRVKLRNRLDAMRRQRDGYRNQLRKARTKEETMSKTFKCVEHEEEVLEVYPFTGEETGRKFSLLMPHVSSNAGITFDSTTAPALALAILEAAGHRPVAYDPERLSGDDLLAYIAHRLAVHVGDEAKRTAEAEAQAKLEAEALKLLLAFQAIDDPDNRGCEWRQYGTNTKDKWLAVARRAREINKENK